VSRQSHRLDDGGRIDRSRPLSFTFDGRAYTGYHGDSLAAALLANGVHLVARSFKYHRPRGIFSAGVEEPNALITLRKGSRHEPNVPATTIELFDGLEARSQNCWPSLRLDAMAAFGLLSPLFSAGFYYKTFIGPTRKAWMFYERFIRAAAGLGKPPLEPDPDRYEKAHAFCDLLVVGGGPAGLAAALAAGRSGARVVLVEEDASLGGALLSCPGGGAEDAWLATTTAELAALPNVRVMTRTTAFGAYDNLVFGLVERVSDHLAEPPAFQPRQRYWVLRTRKAVIATGMIERPLVFANNDLPGVMLASAARSYVNRYGVLPGRRVVVFTNNDGAYEAAFELAAKGAEVTVVDLRRQVDEALAARARKAGLELLAGRALAAVKGGMRVKAVEVMEFDADRMTCGAVQTRLQCDLLAVSGGWTPTLHLLAQRGSKPIFDEGRSMLLPGELPQGYRVTGAAAGLLSLGAGIADGFEQGRAAAVDCGQTAAKPDETLVAGLPSDDPSIGITPVWVVPDAADAKPAKKFVDLQHDVKTDDIALAHREGYRSVEHLKRYTTLGMAADQGKTANVNALAIMAGLRSQEINAVGTTVYRPPYRPVTIGALAGPETGQHFRPTRRSPMHDWHARNGAVFATTGLWLRPQYFPKTGESLREAYVREAAAARQGVGLVDVSSLGKIDVQGPDAATFLDRVYVNGWQTLKVGMARYGVMLRPDGIVLDDGTTSRISEHHYFMTTTTAGAGKVMTFLEYLLQTAWPDLKVQVTSVTSQWAGVAVAGPRSRELLRGLIDDVDFEQAAFPFMGLRHGRLGEIPVRLLRISFSGELAYEVYTAAGYGARLWQALIDAGREFALVPYGTEALGALRTEKGHVAGPELEGRTSLADLGLSKMASRKKPYIGSALARREGLQDADRPQLVGLETVDGQGELRAGAILCEPGKHDGHGLGFVSSVTYSPELEKTIGLGFLSGGQRQQGDVVDAVFALRQEVLPVRIRSPHFVDPGGERLNA
jgi:sarcosine oxidase subunit alpha